ncbi:MAG: hypothetical protein R3E39_10930 [Anaerolineae bacterium]
MANPVPIDWKVFDASFYYWDVVSTPEHVPLWFCGHWLVTVLGICFVSGSIFKLRNHKAIGGWVFGALFFIVFSTPLYFMSAFQYRNALQHIQSISFNDKSYNLALYEAYPVWTTHSGVHLIFECDATGNICMKEKELTAFPLGDYAKTASLEIGDDGKMLYALEGSKQIVVATQTSN